MNVPRLTSFKGLIFQKRCFQSRRNFDVSLVDRAVKTQGNNIFIMSSNFTTNRDAQMNAHDGPSLAGSLFGHKELTDPDKFQYLSSRACNRSSQMVQKLEEIRNLLFPNPPTTTNASTLSTSDASKFGKLILHILDSISNELCSVVDLAEICRNVHVDEGYLSQAENSFTEVTTFIHTLNTRSSIYEVLVILHTNYFELFNDEEKMFLTDMLKEYENEGINMSLEQKETVISIQNAIVDSETTFQDNVVADNQLFQLEAIPKHSLPAIKSWIEAFVPQPDDPSESITMTSSKRIAYGLLKSLTNEDSRRNLWYQIWPEPLSNIRGLGVLVQQRQQLGKVLQFPSYSAKVLEKQSIKSPEAATKLLTELSRATMEQAIRDRDTLTDLKRRYTTDSAATLQPWDISYFSAVHSALSREFVKTPVVGSGSGQGSESDRLQHQRLSEYFALKNCIQGLLLVSERLFGLKFVQRPLDGSENWAVPSSSSGGFLSSIFGSSRSGRSSKSPDELMLDSLTSGLLKFDVYESEDGLMRERRGEGILGRVYVDMYQREGKFPGAAMFTVSGSCRKSAYQVPELNAFLSAGEQATRAQLDEAARAFSSFYENGKSHAFQPSCTTLVMNYSRPTASYHAADDYGGPLLSLMEVETLHHEWGHLLHSLLSRTSFQHLSGTRTAMDFSEVSPVFCCKRYV